MATQKTSGRTFWDALAEWRVSRRALALAFLVFAVFFAGLVAGAALIHREAEPGGTVELGWIKYPKAKLRPEASPSPTDGSENYLLPKDLMMSRAPGQSGPFPILDGTLALQLGRYEEGVLVGANIGKIAVASRRLGGTSAPLIRGWGHGMAALFAADTRTEIQYLGKVFALTARPGPGGSMVVSLAQIPRATLDLSPVENLPTDEPPGGDN